MFNRCVQYILKDRFFGDRNKNSLIGFNHFQFIRFKKWKKSKQNDEHDDDDRVQTSNRSSIVFCANF